MATQPLPIPIYLLLICGECLYVNLVSAEVQVPAWVASISNQLGNQHGSLRKKLSATSPHRTGEANSLIFKGSVTCSDPRQAGAPSFYLALSLGIEKLLSFPFHPPLIIPPTLITAHIRLLTPSVFPDLIIWILLSHTSFFARNIFLPRRHSSATFRTLVALNLELSRRP